MPLKLLSVVLFRSPVPSSQGTDPWHDAFGPFCLPSFPVSALESGTSTPLAPVALTSSGLPSRKPRPPPSNPMLTTHHLHILTHNNSNLEDDALSIADSADSQSSAPPSPTTTAAASSSSSSRSRASSAVPPRRPTIETTEFTVSSIPVLASVSCNQSPLVGAFLNRQWAGVVCTSQRAVQAWAEALVSITHQTVCEYERLDFERRPNELRLPRTTTVWSRIPFFAVGPATSTALKKIVIGPPLGSKVSSASVAAASNPIKPKVILGGKSTGTADMLGRFILNFFDCQPGDDDGEENTDGTKGESTSSLRPQAYAISNPLLVLQGDKALPNLPHILSTAKPHPIPFETMRVYETGVDPHFSANVDSLFSLLARARGIALSRRSSSRSSRRPSGSWASTSASASASASGSGSSSLTASTSASTVVGDAPAPASETRDGWAMGTATLSAEEIARLQGRQQVRAIAAARRAARNAREWQLEADRAAAAQQQQQMGQLAVGDDASRESSASASASVGDGSVVRDRASSFAGGSGGERESGPGETSASVHSSDVRERASSTGWSSRPEPLNLSMSNIIASPSAFTPSPAGSAMPSPRLDLRRLSIGASGGSTLSGSTLQQHAPSLAGVRPDWLVFFSPSGVKYALETLRRQAWLPPAGGNEDTVRVGDGVARGGTGGESRAESPVASTNGLRITTTTTTTTTTTPGNSAPPPPPPPLYPRIATLGPTTARWIIENLGHEGVRVDVIAAKPSPEELRLAIFAFEAGEGGEGAGWTLEAHGLGGCVPGGAVLDGVGGGLEDGD
ncbi:unnamed protein product [Tilletia controversa]|nr:unnamed protein product [Tilletia controversa]CAD6984761.1 unnamed protein product [Tilletia controversa]